MATGSPEHGVGRPRLSESPIALPTRCQGSRADDDASIAVDYIKRGIRCNCICPARVHTPFVERYLAATILGAKRR